MNFTATSFYTFIFILISVFLFIMYLHVKNKKAIKKKQQEEFNRKIREDTLQKFKQTKTTHGTPSQKHRPNYRRYVDGEGLTDSGPDVIDVLVASEVLETITTPEVKVQEFIHTPRVVEEAPLVQETSHFSSSGSDCSSSSSDSSSSCDSCSCSCGD